MNKIVYHIDSTIDNQVAYFLAPKCGCTTIRSWLVLINNPTLLEDIYNKIGESGENFYEVFKKIKEKKDVYIKNNYIGIREAKKRTVRFCIVRDPIERFISTYKQLIKISPILTRISVDEYILIHEKSYDEVSRILHNLTEIEWNNVKHHFKAQYEFYGIDSSIFTHIYNINEMKKVRDMLVEHTKINFPYLHLNSTNGIVEDIFLTDIQKEWVKKTYSIDYDIYKKWI